MASAGDKLHIRAPHLLSRRRRVGDAFVTALMWLLYSYLWAPFISLIAWLLGFEFAYDVMVRAGGIRALKEVLWWYGTVAGCIFLIVATWSLTNRHRFAGHDRRASVRNVPGAELADYFALEPEDFQRMQSTRIMRVALSEAGEVEAVDALAVGGDQRNQRGKNDRSQMMNPASSAR